MTELYLDAEHLLAGRRRVRIACAMVLVLQLAVLVGLALRGMTDRLPYTAIRIAGYAALASFMLMRHSRGAHLLFRLLLAFGLTGSIPIAYQAEQPLQVRLLAGGLSAYFLAVFALITWGKGIPTYFPPRAQADLAQLDRQARAEA